MSDTNLEQLVALGNGGECAANRINDLLQMMSKPNYDHEGSLAKFDEHDLRTSIQMMIDLYGEMLALLPDEDEKEETS